MEMVGNPRTNSSITLENSAVQPPSDEEQIRATLKHFLFIISLSSKFPDT